ncbi:hypothetical protein Acife_2909 [Acidithiobacillus ferrivorans SS3]|uniref:Uncharacterized protein n=1 Tax=Acidithiobacillus ferrivorans SS3 TaxID=743299 RepID=G0JT77_9PROT|nr:hypothetical protein [Acidithiobacillus ferrivorans]AEM48983.1 hypothetical protein Acife_2909 [Acidithiobacillus ferrivorans SS3]MBU2764802.1 hypothetical protein [Acidithiobacillus ferrivorans]MBU2850040.1 hypothetical protein [Acidithiobacillus ferrivorans]OFA17612.1 hypothetical protein A4U49_01280 [Acidithiobacillus ferrivorans]
MKIVYTLVIIGALALFALLLWWVRGQVGDAAAPRDSVGWYARHPDARNAENLKCWKLMQNTPFADVDKVMIAHPHCRAVYEAIQRQDPAHAN